MTTEIAPVTMAVADLPSGGGGVGAVGGVGVAGVGVGASAGGGPSLLPVARQGRTGRGRGLEMGGKATTRR